MFFWVLKRYTLIVSEQLPEIDSFAGDVCSKSTLRPPKTVTSLFLAGVENWLGFGVLLAMAACSNRIYIYTVLHISRRRYSAILGARCASKGALFTSSIFDSSGIGP